ncbi:hypothetical protein AKJ16_DCAP17754 [Drosera capensis]
MPIDHFRIPFPFAYADLRFGGEYENLPWGHQTHEAVTELGNLYGGGLRLPSLKPTMASGLFLPKWAIPAEVAFDQSVVNSLKDHQIQWRMKDDNISGIFSRGRGVCCAYSTPVVAKAAARDASQLSPSDDMLIYSNEVVCCSIAETYPSSRIPEVQVTLQLNSTFLL